MPNILVENIRLPVDCTDGDAIVSAERTLRKNGVNLSGGKVYRKSVDTRHKASISFVYSVVF
ncbi:hypothetical protein FACS1894219_07400 [Clostridia bacterium]|nr:hypothetical protein FACS1894219_07400 [Clostridia bacterium]